MLEVSPELTDQRENIFEGHLEEILFRVVALLLRFDSEHEHEGHVKVVLSKIKALVVHYPVHSFEKVLKTYFKITPLFRLVLIVDRQKISNLEISLSCSNPTEMLLKNGSGPSGSAW